MLPGAHFSEETNKPFLTIATVCFNAEATIGRTIDSVISQTISDYEYLVIDGASQDNTYSIAQAYSSKIEGRMRCISEPDSGIYDAMNKAVNMAKGEFVVFINADDWCEPSLVETMKELYASEPDADVLCGAVNIWNSGRIIRDIKPRKSLLESNIPYHMPVHHQAMAVSVEMMKVLSGFRVQFTLAADYDLALRLIGSNARWAMCDKPVSNFSTGGRSHSLLATASQYRKVRIENGMLPVKAWLLWLKNVINSCFVRALGH